MSFAECLNNIRTSVPEPGSTEDLMLQQCELKVTPTDDTYPRHAMHVYAQNKYCDDWNENMLAFLSGKQYRYIAQDSKKDDCTEMADVHMSDKPRHTGNMRKILNLKVGARVMLTINIDVSDGLTNGAMGTVANIITEEITGEMKTILVEFDNDNVGCEAKYMSLYTNINHNAVPIEKVQVTFPVNRAKQSLQATRKQFPLTLAWAVTIHKCQGLTLPQIVVDMTPTKGTFAAGQAYVAFSRVRTHEKLHIINYTHAQICISPNIELEMQRLRTNMLPEMPQCLFDVNPTALCLLHVNIGNLKTKLPDVAVDSTFKNADVVSLNETHLSANDILTPEMMGLPPDVAIFHHDRNNRGGGVALLVKKKMDAQEIAINVPCEIVAVKISTPLEMVILSVYRPPSEPITQFSNCITQVIAEFTHMPTCIMGDFNEDVFMNKDTHCCSILQQRGFKQMVTKPTQDSGTIIDHVYASPTLNIEMDVNDCYYSDHDSVLCCINNKLVTTTANHA